jgi:hypothetical protein
MTDETGISGEQCGNDYDHEEADSQEWLSRFHKARNKDAAAKIVGRIAKQNASKIANSKPEENKVVGEIWR